MSDRREGGITSLEEVFGARAFARPRPATGAHAAAGGVSVEERDVTESVVTERVDGVPGPVAPRLFVPAADRGTDGPLEEVFLSAQFGKPLTLAAPRAAARSVMVPFPALAQREHTGYRAVAAVSGIAAAAIVLAGVSSGPGHQRPPEVAAQAPRFTSLVPSDRTGGAASGSSPGTPVPGAAGTTPTATLADTGASGPTSAAPAGETLRSDNTATSTATGGGAGSGVTTIPSPGAPSSGPSGAAPAGSGAGSPAPSPPAVGGNPVAPVATALGSTVSTVSASVTSAIAQVASSLPAVATVTSAFTGVGANVVGVTQAMSSTTP